jgi:ribonuclease P protein component
MANLAANKKLHGFSKSERLCNFSLKELLFSQGKSFHCFPFKIYWKTIDPNLEKIFFQKSVTIFQVPDSSLPPWKQLQNPSFRYKNIPENAFFSHPAQCLIGVPAKLHRKATVRNHLKRRIREAYRKNKNTLYSFVQGTDSLLLVAFIYTAKAILSSTEIEQKIIVSLQKLQENILNQQKN